jgi:protein PhnA
MWTQVPAVQVIAWRILTRLSSESWSQGLLDKLYLDESTVNWAQAVDEGKTDEANIRRVDCNGAEIEAGNTVILIKDLNVKGANFTAKRGTAVRGISLVADNLGHIEGGVNGQQIVILTMFVKKSS